MRPVEYHLIQRTLGRWGWWRPLAGTLSLAVIFLVVLPLTLVYLFGIGYALTGADLGDTVERLIDDDHVTPSSLAFLNLMLAPVSYTHLTLPTPAGPGSGRGRAAPATRTAAARSGDRSPRPARVRTPPGA